MSPWQPDNPVQLPDGSWGCESHHLVICGICTVDYSFMQDSDSQDEEEEEEEEEEDNRFDADRAAPSPRQAADIMIPFHQAWNDRLAATAMDTSIPETKLFVPPNSTCTPQTLFPAADSPFDMSHRRFLRNRDMLIYTDGACLHNGQSSPQAGCAFVFRDPGLNAIGESVTGIVAFRLENEGPSGLPGTQTSNRAELRAVIAALQYRVWHGMGEKGLVIATDSEYVVLGVTDWVHTWARRGWLTSSKQPVKNQDLWKALLAELRQYKHDGMDVKFWRIPRQWNMVADEAAKRAATMDECLGFCMVVGYMV